MPHTVIQLVDLDESTLESVTGGMTMPANYPLSTNVIDVRPECAIRDLQERPIDFGPSGWAASWDN